jgi:hypothetical protein|tara:strand:+ start:3487 stop:3684 length:198 start_codon:yes stop_codon:yes gene_type:complete
MEKLVFQILLLKVVLYVDVGTMKLDKELTKNLIKYLISKRYFNLNAYQTIIYDINRESMISVSVN